MAVELFAFDDTPRALRALAPTDYAALAAHIAEAEADPGAWSVDFDPRWRSLLLLSHDPAAEAAGKAYYAESVVEAAQAQAKRQGVLVKVSVEPADEGVTVTSVAGPCGAPVAHGIRRACRSGPGRGYPVLRATFTAQVTGEATLGDVHAAAQQAAMRALTEGGTAPARLDGAGNGEVPPFPELETSAADVVLNLKELCDWQVADMSDANRQQLGAFLAYQLSLLYGHTVDDRMRRVPAAPPAPLRGFMGVVTDELLAYAAERGEGGEMVSGLLDTWTRGWR